METKDLIENIDNEEEFIEEEPFFDTENLNESEDRISEVVGTEEETVAEEIYSENESESVEKPKKVICVGGGTGVAAMHHIAKGHHAAGNYVVSCIGARSKDLLLFHDELSLFSDEVLVSTDDGSMGIKGIVTDSVRACLDREGNNIAEVVAVGPVPMMPAVAELTKEYGVPTTVSLNSLMVDGLGMCGACRVTVGGEMKFTCVDGPEFDGHKVDFAELRMRLGSFRAQETVAKENHRCHCFEKKEA